MRDKPKHVGEGVLLGMRDLGLGVFKGITGIVVRAQAELSSLFPSL